MPSLVTLVATIPRPQAGWLVAQDDAAGSASYCIICSESLSARRAFSSSGVLRLHTFPLENHIRAALGTGVVVRHAVAEERANIRLVPGGDLAGVVIFLTVSGRESERHGHFR